jgi:hypothetical protein
MHRSGMLTISFASILCAIVTLSLLSGCATTKPHEMTWVRIDGRRIADDPALLQQGKTDISVCHADLDAGAPTETARSCMGQKGYTLVQMEQAEEQHTLRLPNKSRPAGNGRRYGYRVWPNKRPYRAIKER